MSATRVRVKVWDGWVRLVHWGIVGLLGFSWWTAETGRMDWHLLSGFAVLALVLFRLAWGFLGSDTARFSRFLRSPVEALRHLSHLSRREADTELGHNAAGGWMVLVLLAVLLVQTVTGLMADDQVLTHGPLARHVSGDTSDLASSIHVSNFWIVLALAGLHVLAVLAYAVLKGQDLVRPMVTGVKRLPAEFAGRAPRLGSPALAALLLALAVAAVWGISRLG
ncbi:cytochrome b/b6 domain-containing protein [Roseomonas sp. BN140053]|uniref:cytochrome b/b6 domain-containing protein n=1 Tax=Roseomonas sp. BN140053 TaxID=3391898 RepID=UPI0039E82B6D